MVIYGHYLSIYSTIAAFHAAYNQATVSRDPFLRGFQWWLASYYNTSFARNVDANGQIWQYGTNQSISQRPARS